MLAKEIITSFIRHLLRFAWKFKRPDFFPSFRVPKCSRERSPAPIGPIVRTLLRANSHTLPAVYYYRILQLLSTSANIFDRPNFPSTRISEYHLMG